MFRIYRPPEIPSVLRDDYVRRAKADLFSYLRRPVRERAQRRAPIDYDFFRNEQLLDPLTKVFGQKCAFCETSLESNGIVDHFRPVREGSQSGSQNDKDYYAWLAFEWRNIFLVCEPCNKAKQNQFPVEGGRADYMAAYDDVRSQEKNLLIDPTVEDPGRHFRFLMDGYCHPSTTRGQATVKVLDLNRRELVSARRESLNELRREWSAVFESTPIEKVFGFHLPHIGARLDVLRRAASISPIAALVASVTRRGLPRAVGNALRQLSEEERRQFAGVLDEISGSDRQNRVRFESLTLPVPEMPPIYQGMSEKLLAPDRELARIELNNVKAIEKLELGMPSRRRRRFGAPCMMLLGENSVGKSTALASIALALIGTKEARRLRLDFNEFVRSTFDGRWDQLEGTPVNVRVGFHFSDHQAMFRYDPEGRNIDGTREPSCLVLGYGPRRYFSRKRRDRPSGGSARVKTLFDPLAVIPYPGSWLQSLSPTQFDVVARALRVVLSLNEDDELISDDDRGICVRAAGQTTPIDRLSEGYRSVFAMVTDILRELLGHWSNLEDAQAVVLIDEIETHLHPRWKMRVMSSLRRALPRVQFIATTHDPLCLRGMDDHEVVVLQRDEENRVRQLTDLPSVKGMRAEQLLTSDYFGLASTTDPELERDMARLSARAARDEPESEDHDLVGLLDRLVMGDTAKEQVIYAALDRFIQERDRRSGELRTDVRREAVDAVLSALTNEGGEEP
jgi:uncharacterized protein (TIGR02646 family)